MNKSFALLGVAVLLLAGCSSAPAAGTFTNTNFQNATFAVTATLTYTHFDAGTNPLFTNGQCQAPAAGQPVCDQAACKADGLSGPSMGNVKPCTQPSTKVVGNFTLPDPGTQSYKLYFVGGPKGEEEIADLQGSAGAYTVAKTFQVDLTGQHLGVELRMTGFVVATAPATGGPMTFTQTPTSGITVTGGYTGTTLDVTVGGLPANGTYVGRLYTLDANGKATPQTVDETFSVQNGEVKFETKKHASLAEYAEFHIHVGDSMLNLYKGTITPAAK